MDDEPPLISVLALAANPFRSSLASQRATNRSAKSGEGLNENSGLRGHVEAAGNARALEGLRLAVPLTELHQTRHLVLREHNVLAAGLCQINVGYSGSGGCVSRRTAETTGRTRKKEDTDEEKKRKR